MTAVISNTPCTLITGFLGSGKTTLINQLLVLKPITETWALLINEFGQIGIDARLIDSQADTASLAIREVSGGCICCSSQLPLQIALSRLLAEHRPQRLLIEPTGLAHPQSLLTQLSEPHWQTSLAMRSVIGVLSALQWQQPKYREHQGYQAHINGADAVVINRGEYLADAERQLLIDWIERLNPQASVLWMPPLSADQLTEWRHQLVPPLQSASQLLSKLGAQQQSTNRISLRHPTLGNSLSRVPPSSQNGTANTLADRHPDNEQATSASRSPTSLPYRYHDQQQGMMVGGWRLPAQWQLRFYQLQDWLLTLPDWQRIKGVVHTTEGWQQLNLTPDSLSITSTEAQLDSRLEIILTSPPSTPLTSTVTTSVLAVNTTATEQQWQQWDNALMSLVVSQ